MVDIRNVNLRIFQKIRHTLAAPLPWVWIPERRSWHGSSQHLSSSPWPSTEVWLRLEHLNLKEAQTQSEWYMRNPIASSTFANLYPTHLLNKNRNIHTNSKLTQHRFPCTFKHSFLIERKVKKLRYASPTQKPKRKLFPFSLSTHYAFLHSIISISFQHRKKITKFNAIHPMENPFPFSLH